MARQDYMTIGVPRTVQEMFREFIELKGVTVKEALSDMLEIYMMATDIELYEVLKTKKLNVEEAKNMIMDRDSLVSKNNSIFMKLGYTDTVSGKVYGGKMTMQAYLENCKKNGYTWYSTNSLKTGMNADKVNEYNDLAQTGNLKIYYAMNQDDIDNNITHVADVEEIVSYQQPTCAPCEEWEYPEEWRGCSNNIWIKIKNLKVDNSLSADDFVVASTGNNLRDVIRKGQYIFGYIRRK